MSCLIFGAGKIARGFIGDVLFISHIPFVFVEKSDALCDLINERGRYHVNVFGAPEKSVDVTGARALKFSDEDEIVRQIASVDCIFCSVGGKNLGGVAPFLVKGLKARAKTGKPINLLTCENWTKPADVLKDAVYPNLSDEEKKYFDEKVGFTEAVILRSGIDATEEQKAIDPLWVNTQDFWDLPFDASRIKAPMPKGMKCLHPMEDFGGFLLRKFYTYNAANGTTSYVGALLGYEHIAEAAYDPFIVNLLDGEDGIYKETSTALCNKTGYPFDEQWAFTRTSLHKLQDRNIIDTIERNARDPIRKLGPNDRLVGAANLCLEEGVEPNALSYSIAAAIYYHSPSDPIAVSLENMRKEKGVDYVLENVCKIDPKSHLADLIRDKIAFFKKEGKIHD